MSSEPRKHLYIRASAGLHLRLVGADTLLILRQQDLVLSLPLSRIGQLTLQGDLPLSSQLLHTLTRAGIYIQLVDASAEHRTEIAGMQTACTWEAGLDELLEHLNWKPAYQHWRLRQNLWAAARALGHSIRVIDLLQFRHPSRLSRALFAHRPRAQALFREIQPFLHSDLHAILAERGWPAAYRRRNPAGPHIKRDLLHAMHYQILQHLRHSAIMDSATWYACHRESLRARARATLDSFSAWLAQQLTQPQ